MTEKMTIILLLSSCKEVETSAYYRKGKRAESARRCMGGLHMKSRRMKRLIKNILENMHGQRKMVLLLSCIVVFTTTYLLILPAFTLDKEEAAEQGGIDLSAASISAETEAEDNKSSDQEDPVEIEDLEDASEDEDPEELEDPSENEDQ